MTTTGNVTFSAGCNGTVYTSPATLIIPGGDYNVPIAFTSTSTIPITMTASDPNATLSSGAATVNPSGPGCLAPQSTCPGSAPFCYASVSVYLAMYPDSFAESEKSYQVYWAPCATPAQAADVPKVQWLAKDALQVTYTPGPPAKDETKLRKRVVDASRYVQVTYVERK